MPFPILNKNFSWNVPNFSVTATQPIKTSPLEQKKIAGNAIVGQPIHLGTVCGINQKSRQALQGRLMFAWLKNGTPLLWLQGSETNYPLRNARGEPITNPLEANKRAHELITYGATNDLFQLANQYFCQQPKPSGKLDPVNQPTGYVVANKRWLPLGAYGSVELGKAGKDFYIRTRRAYYKIPHHVEKTSPNAIATWAIKAIQHGAITSELYPVILPRSSPPKNHSASLTGLQPYKGERTMLDINRGRINQGLAQAYDAIDFKPLNSPECWLGTRYGQVVLGTSQTLPGRFMVKTKNKAYYLVPVEQSISRDAIKKWVENAIVSHSLTTALWPNTIAMNYSVKQTPGIGKDLRFYYKTTEHIVDEEYGHRLTSSMRPDKNISDDFTLRIQPWRGNPLFLAASNPKEELVECKVISTLRRPGCDIKSKWIIPTDKMPHLSTILKKIHGKIEFESSGAIRYVEGQVLGQGAVAIKLNISNPSPGSLVRLVVGLEFPQFSAPMMPIIERVLPHLARFYELLTNPPKDRGDFARKFDDLAGQILIPITMLGGQISLVYPANNAIKKGLSATSVAAAMYGWEPLAAILKGAEGTLSGLEKATGFNIRIAYTHTLRDPQIKLDSGNFVAGNSRHVLLVGKNSAGRPVTASRVEFTRSWFGDRFLDPTLSEYAGALFERGFNAFQVATLIPLRQANPKIDKLAADPETALLSPAPFVPQRFEHNQLMQLADQIAQTVIDIRGRLPANALRDLPRIFNNYQEAAATVQKIRKIIHSYSSSEKPTSLEKRFLSGLSNRYGVDWGIAEVRQLNKERYGIDLPDQRIQSQIDATKTTPYRVTGGPNDKPEIITKCNDPSEKKFVLSIWRDNFNGKNFNQKRHIGLVSPTNPVSLKKSLEQSIR